MLQKPTYDEHESTTKKLHQSDPKNQPILAPFLKLYNFIISTGAIPVRLIFFENIGERSISILGWFLSLIGHFYYAYNYAMTVFIISGFIVIPEYLRCKVETLEDNYSLLWFVFVNSIFVYFLRAILFEGISLINSFDDDDFSEATVEKGSYYRGDSILTKPDDYIGTHRNTFLGKKLITKDNFNIFIEPKKIFLFGIYFSIFSLILSVLVLAISESMFWIWCSIFILSNFPVGILVSLSAICLFLEEYSIRKRIRDAALDIIDAEKDLELILQAKMTIEGKKQNISPNTNNYPTVKIG